MEDRMNNYVDFIESASANAALAGEFKKALNNFSSEKLCSWFNEKGYNIDAAVCESIVSRNESKDSLKSRNGVKQQY
jgi:hypothetical protein